MIVALLLATAALGRPPTATRSTQPYVSASEIPTHDPSWLVRTLRREPRWRAVSLTGGGDNTPFDKNSGNGELRAEATDGVLLFVTYRRNRATGLQLQFPAPKPASVELLAVLGITPPQPTSYSDHGQSPEWRVGFGPYSHVAVVLIPEDRPAITITFPK